MTHEEYLAALNNRGELLLRVNRKRWFISTLCGNGPGGEAVRWSGPDESGCAPDFESALDAIMIGPDTLRTRLDDARAV